MASGDNACRNYQSPKNPCLLVEEAANLLEETVTQDNINRHMQLLNDFLETSPNAYYLVSLPHVIRILDVLSQKYQEMDVYKAPLERMLQMCCNPLLLTKPSDVLYHERDLQEYFTQLGYLLVFLNTHTDMVTLALINLFKEPTPKLPQFVSLEMCVRCAANSQLPEILGQFAEIALDDTYENLLEIVAILAKMSEKFCDIILKKNMINVLLMRLESTWRQRYSHVPPPDCFTQNNLVHYELTSDILWIFLKYLSNHKQLLSEITSPNQFSLWSLKYALRWLTLARIEPIERNNIVAIILMLLQLFPNMDFVNSGLAYDIILLFLTANGENVEHTWLADVGFISNEANYLLFEMLLVCLPHYVQNLSRIRILENKMVINVVLKLIRDKQKIAWEETYHNRLIKVTMVVLTKIAPSLLEDFMENNGPSILLGIVRVYKDADDSILKVSLEVLKRLTKSVQDFVKDSLIWNHGLSLMLGICEKYLEKDFLNTNDQNILSLAFCILEICRRYSNIVICYNASILCIQYMKRILNPKANQIQLNNEVIICLMDFLWASVVQQDIQCTSLFVDQGGIYLLLDIIQRCDYPVKIITLGVLVDICENPLCVPYLITWRGVGSQKLRPLILEIFREENRKLGVASGSNGEILDENFPVMGRAQRIDISCDCDKQFAQGCIADMFATCRPKIYAILGILNYNFEETVEIANEAYRLYNDELEAKDQVTLLLAENFLALKLGEAWREVNQELAAIKLTPTILDGEMLNYLLLRSSKWGIYLKNTQLRIINKQKKKEEAEELEFYADLCDLRLASSLDALKEMKYIAKCTEKMFQSSRKIVQDNALEQSLRSMNTDKLNITTSTKFTLSTLLDQQFLVESDVRKHDSHSLQDLTDISESVMYVPCQDAVDDHLESPKDVIDCSDPL